MGARRIAGRLFARLGPVRRRDAELAARGTRLRKAERELASVRRSYERMAIERRSQAPWLRYLSRHSILDAAMTDFDPGNVGLVIAHDSPALPGAVPLADRTGARLIYDAVEVPHLQERSSAAYQGLDRDPAGVAAVEAFESALIARADAILTVSTSLQDWLRHRYPSAPVHVVRNCRDQAERDSPGIPAGDVRVHGDGHYLILPNASYPGTGAEMALRALAELPEDFKLVIAGQLRPQTYAGELTELATLLNVAHRVHFSGMTEPAAVKSLLAQADVALITLEPSILNMRGALPNRLFESFDAGLPIVTGDLPDIAEVVRRYDVGEVYTDDTPAAVAAAIQQSVARLAAGSYASGLTRIGVDLQWENEIDSLLASALPAATEGSTNAVIVANKLLEINRRVPRLARTLQSLGYDVHVVGREACHPTLRPPDVTWWMPEDGTLVQVEADSVNSSNAASDQ